MTPNPIAEFSESNLPHNLEAELAVLGNMLISPLASDEIVQRVNASAFFDNVHRQIFLSLRALRDRGESKIDQAMLAHELKSQGAPDELVSQRFFETLCEQEFSLDDAIKQANVVHEMWIRRNLIETCRQISQEAMDNNLDFYNLLRGAWRRLDCIYKQDVYIYIEQEKFTSTLEEARNRIFEQMDKPVEYDPSLGEPSHQHSLLPTLQPGEILIHQLSDREERYSLISHWALSAASSKQKVLIVSMKEPGWKVAEKMMCQHAAISSFSVQTGTLTEEQQAKVLESFLAMKDLPIRIDDSDPRSISRLAAAIRRFKLQHGIRLILIDCLHSIPVDEPETSTGTHPSPEEGLARLAKELNVAVISFTPALVKPQWWRLLPE